jgi:hypothetical protein
VLDAGSPHGVAAEEEVRALVLVMVVEQPYPVERLVVEPRAWAGR